MTIREVAQKERNLEAFNTVAALYTQVKNNNPRPVMYDTKEADSLSWQDTVSAFSLDYALDVELKSKRLLGAQLCVTYLRSILNEQAEVIPSNIRESLGSYWVTNGLGPEGSYRKLFAAFKNAQMRSYLKEQNGIFRADDGIDNIIAG